jgi:radical SAM protein with 4Fe4S-binding SPASM domain
LRGYPLSLTFEATNVCNLRCPYCFTGAGEQGRIRSMMPLDLYHRLLDELGDYALEIDFYNWGEPLLNKNIYEMIRLAADRGIATIISSNLSVPFDSERAEKLVASGLAAIGAGIDGARQESLEQYRVGASFEKVMANIKLLIEAKEKLRSETPAITWSFHVFDHNKQEIAEARRMANALGIRFTATKGWVAGEEQDPQGESEFPIGTAPTSARCKYLWSYAIVNNDGRVAPCAACFYEEDDYGSVAESTFIDVWNNEKFQEARRLYHSRQQASACGKSLVCFDCPYTLVWEDYQQHRASGKRKSDFRPRFTTNDWFNYFFLRRPNGKSTAPAPADMIELQPVSSPKND